MLQPVINTLVNPLHHIFLRIGIIKPHIASKNNRATNLTSVVSIPNVDIHDMERRRQIALKALSERLARTTDASKQHQLPKSFPHHHHGGHGHGHHSDSNQPQFMASQQAKVPMTFTIPAIPLPAPPSMQQNATEPTPHSQTAPTNLIDLNTNTTGANNS